MESLTLLLAGNPPPELRIWSALAPALLICAWFIVGMAAFLVRSALWGVPRDAETLARGGSLLVGEFLRHYFFWLMSPVWKAVVRSGIPPTAITTLSALLGLGSGAAAAAGRFALAGWLFVFSGALDTLDWRLARLRGQATPWGAAIDSSLDRWSDSAVLVGLAWYYRGSWVLLVCLLALMGTSLVPYIRARGEGLGVSVRDGLAQRAERVMYLGVGVALSPVVEALLFPGERHPMHWLAVGALVALAVTSNLTAVGRLRAVVRALRAKAGLPPARSGASPLSPSRLALAAATAVDAALALWLVLSGSASALHGTALGCAAGALVHLGLGVALARLRPGAPRPRLGRRVLVEASSLLLNVGGVSVLLSLPAMPFALAWVLIRGAVLLLWAGPLQAVYVFEPAPGSGRPADPPLPSSVGGDPLPT